MTYKILLTPRVRKDLLKLPPPIQSKISRKIDSLAKTPRPRGMEKLSGEDDIYRVRTGDYRIIYQIQDKQLIVLVVKVGHRRDIYRKR